MKYKKITLLNGLGEQDSRYEPALALVEDELQQNSGALQAITLRGKKLTHCVGCFGCWLQTPGECVYRDDISEILKSYITSDLVVFFSPVAYGGYSPEFKLFLDRIIPIIHPNFGFYQKEIHHKPRYKTYPRLIVIGMQDHVNETDAGLFKTIAGRNAINFHTPSYAAEVYTPAESDTMRENFRAVLARKDPYPLKDDVLPLLSETGSGPFEKTDSGHALLIVGSPKKESSTSAVLGGEVLERLEAAGWGTGSLKLKPSTFRGENWEDPMNRVKNADQLLLTFPLYIDSLPYLVTRLFDLLGRENRKGGFLTGKRLFVISNNGFPEAYQNGPAVAICRNFARANGMAWAGSLALGSGEAISGGRPLDSKDRHGPPVDHIKAALDLAAAAIIDGTVTPPRAKELFMKSPIPLMSFSLWRRMFAWFGQMHWRRDAGEYGNSRKEMDARPYVQ